MLIPIQHMLKIRLKSNNIYPNDIHMTPAMNEGKNLFALNEI